ncbi:hypothetical protein MMC11_004345 [Xylographa trunciseda]|nr:hypothetical protein [Xylographa trunciseda]
MNLAEAICKVLYKNKYRIMQFVIFHIFNKSQAAAAEVIFTRLAQGHIHDGGGFRHALAGRSNHSALSIRSLEWDKFLDEAVRKSGLIDRLDKEANRLKQETVAVRGNLGQHIEPEQLQKKHAAIKTKAEEMVEGVAKLYLDAESLERAELLKRRKKAKEPSLRLRLHGEAMEKVLG